MAIDIPQFGWIGPEEAKRAWDEGMAERFVPFQVFGATERKRTCAWDSWEKLGFDITTSVLRKQETGDCVSFGAAIAYMASAAYEIARNGQFWEKLRIPFPPYLYGISRVTPEGGNGRLRGRAGSLGSWMADAMVVHGVLPADYEGVPQYSGRLADSWGDSDRDWRPFVEYANDFKFQSASRINSIEQLTDAICNGYFATIASMRGYDMRLRNRDGKSWFVGRDSWPHQMSIIAYDVDPEPCFYRMNQWGNAHGDQLDGPRGGGWVTAESLEREVKSNDCELFVHSFFDGFPSDLVKPLDYFC